MPRKHPDAPTLLRMSIAHSDMLDERTDGGYDPDSPAARASLERILMAPPLTTAQTRGTPAHKLALVAAPVTLLAGGGLAAALSLSDSHGGIAKASVLAHAATALQQPGTITYLQLKDYGAHEVGPCLPAGRPEQEGMPALSGCLAGMSPANQGTQQSSSPQNSGVQNSGVQNNGISANPANDTLTYSSQAWSSPNGSEERVLYGDGDEAVTNTNTSELETFVAADDEATTLTDTTGSDPGLSCKPPLGPLLSSSDLASPACYEGLYEQAEADERNAKLIGQTTIEGQSVYELQFDFEPQPPKNPPAGDMCGDTVCVPPDMETLLYLDSSSFTPVRVVDLTVNSDDRPGIPAGSQVQKVTDFVVEHLPDTPANEQLLQMPSHPGSSQVQQTEAHYRQELGSMLKALTARNALGGASASRRAAP